VTKPANERLDAPWRRAAESALAHSPLQAAFSLAARRRLAVLAYHGVPESGQFATHLDWLSANTSLLGLKEARRVILREGDTPRRPVLLTFDDGERSILEVAAPLLRERGIPAVAFVVAGLVDTDLPFWWVEVEELMARGAKATYSSAELVRRLKRVPNEQRIHAIQALRAQVAEPVRTLQLRSEELRKLELDGVMIGNHSFTHPCLDQCDDELVRREVRESHERLTTMLGHPPASFAYPNGNWDRRVIKDVGIAGYELAFTFDHSLVSRNVNPLTVSRVRVDASARRDALRIRASGLHPQLHRMRGLK
jgi:peptidoglycan/xylan/chitin deacetylase (PgdA/CDA1 family)